MPYSRFDTARWNGTDEVTVTGPIGFAADEQGKVVVTSLNFVLVQGNVFVRGSARVDGKGPWTGKAENANNLREGPAQGFGAVMLVRRAQRAAAATAQKPATPAKPPVVEMLTWSEPIMITR
jgi:hypothetical protein